MIPYTPKTISTPERVLADVPSGWKGLETILGSIVTEFCPKHETALEFGVEYGFSTVALSNFFDKVYGVDWFRGDTHAGLTPDGVDRYAETRERLKQWLVPNGNIMLMQSSWQEFTKNCHAKFDLIHVDAFHDFHTTYMLGRWAAEHATCVILHDTTWFAEVAPAIEWVAKGLGKTAYNFPDFNGLGILV